MGDHAFLIVLYFTINLDIWLIVESLKHECTSVKKNPKRRVKICTTLNIQGLCELHIRPE